MWTAIVGFLAPKIFKGLERAFGPKTGTTKMSTAMKMLTTFLEQMASAGTLGGPPPSEKELKDVLEDLLLKVRSDIDWPQRGVLDLAGGKRYEVVVIGEVKN